MKISETSISNSLDNLFKLTLLVPTYGRHQTLPNLFRYYSNWPITLLVADGTPGSPFSFSDNGIKQAKNIIYTHQPDKSLVSRLKWLCNTVDSEYCAWLSDDEFQIPTGLAKSIYCLDHDPLASATGSTKRFLAKKDKGVVLTGPSHDFKPKVFSSNVASRIEDYFLHYAPTMSYAVWRTSCYKHCITAGVFEEWSSNPLIEFIHAFVGLCVGNHLIHDELQWLSSSTNKPTIESIKSSLGIIGWLKDEEYSSEVSKLSSLMSIFMSQHLSPSLNSTQLLNLAFNCYHFWHLNRFTILEPLGLSPIKAKGKVILKELLSSHATTNRIHRFDKSDLEILNHLLISF